MTLRCAKLEESRQLRREFQASVTKEHDWLDGRVKAADKLDTIRLLASDVEKQADKCKVCTVCMCVCVPGYMCLLSLSSKHAMGEEGLDTAFVSVHVSVCLQLCKVQGVV